MTRAPRPRFPAPALLTVGLLTVGLLTTMPLPTHAQEAAPAAALEAAGPTFDATRRAIDAILASPEIGSSRVGLYAVDVNSGEVVYAKNPDLPLNPASNIKLITVATVLDTLGPGHTYTTRVHADRVEDGVVRGNLYVRGDGDGFVLFNDVLGWAGELRRKGVSRVEGDVVVDDSYFSEGYLPPLFDQKDTDASYRSPIGAVSVNFNAVTVVVEPGEPGKPAQLRLEPPNDHVSLVNRTTTGRGAQARVDAAARPDGEATVLTVSGTIGDRAQAVSIRRRIDNPPMFAGSVLVSALKMVGIEFSGTVRKGVTPAEARILVSHQSQPTIGLLAAMNKWSNNFMAEQLMLSLGARDGQPAAWSVALGQATDFLTRAQLAPGYQILNGSGLYDGNAVSARQFVQLLTYMRSHRFGPEFLSTLAIAGVDGTLRTRFTNTPLVGNLRAKTGSLNHVTTLTGYLQTRSGRLLAFSILINDTPVLAWNLRRHQDAIVTALYEIDE